MEKPPNLESRESIIGGLINRLAESEGMNPEDVSADIITFAPYEGNRDPNPDYLDQVADMIGISSEEMKVYAIKKAEEYFKSD